MKFVDDDADDDELRGQIRIRTWCCEVVGTGMLQGVIFSERELMFMFAICRRPSVCLSVCRLSVLCNILAPYSGD